MTWRIFTSAWSLLLVAICYNTLKDISTIKEQMKAKTEIVSMIALVAVVVVVAGIEEEED